METKCGIIILNGIIRKRTINKCKETGIERAYVNSYDWIKKVYNSAGFETEDSIGYWYIKIR